MTAKWRKLILVFIFLASSTYANHADFVDPGRYKGSDPEFDSGDTTDFTKIGEKSETEAASPTVNIETPRYQMSQVLDSGIKTLASNPDDAPAKQKLDDAFKKNPVLMTQLMQQKFPNAGITREKLEKEGCGNCAACEAKKQQGQ